IPLEWLDKLVEGTAMDVQAGAGSGSASAPDSQPSPEMGHSPDPETCSGSSVTVSAQSAQTSPLATYETFDQLYDYCYHVASVVGLVCIRIFGYRDPRAEKLAEQTGVAFQLTNILRDVREDAQLGRVYLPREDFARFGLDVHTLTNGSAPEALRPVLEFEALRARGFYRAAEDLLPLIDEDSQPALWTLVEIYRRLLERIIARNYDVFSEKVSVPTAEKLSVLSKGFWRRLT